MTTPTVPRRRFLGRPEGVGPGFVPGAGQAPGLDVERPWADGARAGVRAGRLWLAQALTGALLLAFLGLHLVAQHFMVDGGLRDYDAVVAWLRQPVALVAELGLSAAVLVHVVLGIRTSLVEIVGDARWLRRLSVAVALAGLAAFVYIAWLTWMVIR